MSEVSEAIQAKCLAFGDRVIRLNDYLLTEACKREDVRCKKEKSGRIPIQLLAVANLSNQLLRAGTSIGANNAEPTNEASAEPSLLELCLARRRKTKSSM